MKILDQRDISGIELESLRHVPRVTAVPRDFIAEASSFMNDEMPAPVLQVSRPQTPMGLAD